MYLQTKEEINRLIGRKSFFKKIPKSDSVLEYVSGIQELTNEKKDGILSNSFFIANYPKGLLIADRKEKYRIGISFTELKNIEITKKDSNTFEVTFNTSFSKGLTFSFQRKHRLKILPFIKVLSYKELGDPREDEIAREEILKLKEVFAIDYFTDRTFCQELKSVAKKNTILEINEKQIKYGDRVIDISSVTGYSINIEELSHLGISRFEYNVRILRREEPLFISFTSVSMFLKQGEHSSALNTIGAVLYDVISRPIVTKWLDAFANGESVNAKEFSLSRQGLTLNNTSPAVLIHWDEIIAENMGLFRWPYSSFVFLKLDDDYDQRCNMLFYLIKWIQHDPKRLKALMGREYLV